MEDILVAVKKDFPYVNEENLAMLLAMGEPRMLEAGEVFIKRGENTKRVAFVLNGCMRNYLIDDEGREVTVVFAREMQAIAAYACVFMKRNSNETTEAIQPTMIMVYDYDRMKETMNSDPVLARMYGQMMEGILIAAIQRIEVFAQTKPEERYRQLLENEPHLLEAVPLKYLASYLGITPVSLSRIRKRFAVKSRN